MKHIYRKKIVMVTALLLLSVLCSCREKQENKISEKKINYEKEENSIEVWKEELTFEEEEVPSAASVRGMQVIKEGEVKFAVSYEPREYKNSYDCWAISVPYHSWVSVDTERLYEYFSCLENLSLEKITDIPENTGLEDSQTSLFIAYYSGQNQQEQGQAEPDKGITYQIGLKNANGDYYVKINEEEGVWQADGAVVNELLNLNPFDCVLKVANVVSIETISTVDIDIEGKKYIIDFTDGESCRFNKKKVEKEEAYELYTSLISIFVEKENLKKEHTGEIPLLTITYNRNMDSAPRIVEEFYAYNEEYASVSINGDEIFLVDRESVDTLIAQIQSAF